MEMWSLIFLTGICFSYATANLEVRRGIYHAYVKGRMLWDVAPMAVAPEPGRTIDLSDLRLKKIRNNVFDRLMNVTTLNLANNNLEKIPPFIFCKLESLQTLLLANNKLSTFDRSFFGLRNLKILDLSNNSISSLTNGDLLGLPKSVNLITDGNPLREFPENSFENPSLAYYIPFRSEDHPWSNLNWFDSEPVVRRWDNVTNMPAFSPYVLAWNSYFSTISKFLRFNLCIRHDGFLESLSIVAKDESPPDCLILGLWRGSLNLPLQSFELKKFRRRWYNIPQDLFETLNLSSNKISEVTPELLNDLPATITFLELDNNNITIIKKNIIRNIFLKEVSFNANRIVAIENGAFRETKLVSISFNYNHLKNHLKFVNTLPKTIRELKLSGNKISKLPEDFLSHLRGLQYLEMADNDVSHIPVGVFRGLRELKLIDLSNNSLETIEPRTFEDQEKLLLLRLSSNNIKELTSGIFNGLKMVRSITLMGNAIKKIAGDSFAELRNLIMYEIVLSENQIDTIEEGSFSYMTINQLHLDSNNISERSVAKGAFELCTLYELVLRSNPFTNITGDSFNGILLYSENHFPL